MNHPNASGTVDQTQLVQLQQQIRDALPASANLYPQDIDLTCSQAWLQTLIWQLALRHGLLSSKSDVKAMTFDFPYKVGSNVARLMADYPTATLREHGAILVGHWKLH